MSTYLKILLYKCIMNVITFLLTFNVITKYRILTYESSIILFILDNSIIDNVMYKYNTPSSFKHFNICTSSIANFSLTCVSFYLFFHSYLTTVKTGMYRFRHRPFTAIFKKWFDSCFRQSTCSYTKIYIINIPYFLKNYKYIFQSFG